ncbi:anti-sigma factor [Gammaproteobacteria bacterium]|jgi:anti-sigma factor (TIGR02949 family)|nr:anti-sigma factor [Gammaproteobacteria bacterium]
MNKTDDKSDSVDIGCLQAIDALYAYLDGELDDPASVTSFEHHMQHCRSCYSRAEIEGLLTARLRETARSQAPEALQARLRKLMDDF